MNYIIFIIKTNFQKMSEIEKNKNNLKPNHLSQIKQIISSQTNEINRIQQYLNNIIDIYKEYVILSKEFSQKLENLAMKLKPDDKTFEGKLIQAFQGILLFNSNSVSEMVIEMNKGFGKENGKDIIEDDVETYKNFTEVYFGQYNKTMETYKSYESEVEFFENYLINKELGLIKDENQVQDINIKSSNFPKKTNNIQNNNKKNYYNNNGHSSNNHNNIHIKNNSGNKLFDNHKSVFLNQQKFVNNLRACNDILKNLFDFFTDEKNKMRNQIFNYCHSFNDSILYYLKKQHENCLNQKLILENLIKTNNIIESEGKDLNKYFLKPNLYCLKCLKMEESSEYNNKSYIKKNLSIEQSLNIIQTFRNNGLILNQVDKTKEGEENNKQEIDEIIDILFNKTYLFDDSHKQKIILLLNDKIYQIYFLNLLNKYRTKGKFILNKTALNNLGYLFQYLNELIIKNDEINLFKLIFIMSLTFYYQDSETYKKYYLLKYIENHQSFKNKIFWENYLEGLINSDVESNKKYEKEKKEEWQEINYIIFSNIISVTKCMSDFHLGKDFINEFLENITKTKYNLNEEQKIQINFLLIDNEYGSLIENERSTLSTDIIELNQSLSYNNSLDNNLIDNNLIRTSSSNNLDNTRNSSISSNNPSQVRFYKYSYNSNITTSKLKELNINDDSDERSLESIDIEEMIKKN